MILLTRMTAWDHVITIIIHIWRRIVSDLSRFLTGSIPFRWGTGNVMFRQRHSSPCSRNIIVIVCRWLYAGWFRMSIFIAYYLFPDVVCDIGSELTTTSATRGNRSSSLSYYKTTRPYCYGDYHSNNNNK